MTKVYSFDIKKNKTILCGHTSGDTFFKDVTNRHFMRVVNGYGISTDAFDSLFAGGITKVNIYNTDSKQHWHSSIEDWQTYGKIADYGSGKQIFLSLKYMHTKNGI